MEVAAFYIFATIAVIASLLVVGQRNPMYSVMLLITSFGALAGGAIMVLFLFVVMLLNVPREEPAPRAVASLLGPTGLKIGAVLSGLLAIEMVWALSRIPSKSFDPGQANQVSDVRNIGQVLFTDHAFAFEATSVLILVAMVGAVVLARREH
jgi:NADH-quinone oxidoreductase subunit J